MTDYLKKLGKELQDIKPSKAGREKALANAMDAFEAEFASDSVTDHIREDVSERASKKNKTPSQGIEDTARPTGQSAHHEDVPTPIWSGLMKNINSLFNFNPKSSMMMGSCAAALIAAMIVIPNINLPVEEPAPTNPIEQVASADPQALENRTRPDVTAEAPLKTVDAVTTPPIETEIGNETLKSEAIKPVPPVEVENRNETISLADNSSKVETSRSQPEPKIVQTTESILASFGIDDGRPSEVITLIKRVIKIPGEYKEKFIPAVTEPLETRIIIKPAQSEWKLVGKNENGGDTYEKVIIPAKYETQTGTIIVQEAHTELVHIPPVYQTVEETIRIFADETTETLATKVLDPTQTDLKDLAAREAALDKFNPDRAKVRAILAGEAEIPEGMKLAERVVPAVPKQETRRRLKTPARTVERTIPAVTKQEARRVVKTPARTTERTIPAITKQVNRQVAKADGSFETISETVVVQPATTEFVTIPPTYETVMETVVVQDASTELVSVPATFETYTDTIVTQEASTEMVLVPIDAADPAQDTVVVTTSRKAQGGISSVNSVLNHIGRNAKTVEAENRTREAGFAPGFTSSQELTNSNPPQEFTVFNGESTEVVQSTETTVGQTGEILARAEIPPKYKTVEKRVVKTPASTQERVIPAVTKEVTVNITMEDGSTKDVTQTFVIQESRVELVSPPPVFETVTERIALEVRRDNWNPTFQNTPNRNRFKNFESNPTLAVAENSVSTFSIDVDTASYSFFRSSVERGQLPPPGAVRLEEMINYFPYDYEAPKSAKEPFKANVTVTESPWNSDTKLMHIGIKGYVPPIAERPDNNLVFLIDTSGSMRAQNKLPLLINSFKLMLNTLDEDDTVSIVTYAGSAGTVLEPTPANEVDKIIGAFDRLQAGGSTAGAAGLELAYKEAKKSFHRKANNRIILATDGDFNVGFSSADEMKTFIEKKRKTGIFLSVLGFGNGNYNDQLMQSLAQNGNGIAAYIDNLSEAQKVLADQAGGALTTIAKDVKIQVEFNPETIAEYRLIGYETRALKREDFNNDKVDAGDIGAGHSVTAIYELTPVSASTRETDPLRYVSETPVTTGSEEYAFVKIRHKLPDADKSTLQTVPIGVDHERSLRRASDDMRFATAVAALGQKLRSNQRLEGYSYDEIIKLANKAKGDDEDGYRAEFVQLVKLVDGMTPED